MQTIIFILASGHSGSTVLDKAIGSLPNGHSLGEIDYFSSFIESDSLCSCGVSHSECKFWIAKREKLIEQTGIAEMALFPTKLQAFGSGYFLNRVVDAVDFGLILIGIPLLLNSKNELLFKTAFAF